MRHTKKLTAAALAGMLGAMSLFSGVTAYAATGWQQSGSTCPAGGCHLADGPAVGRYQHYGREKPHPDWHIGA